MNLKNQMVLKFDKISKVIRLSKQVVTKRIEIMNYISELTT